jgi:hypothetical protein
MNGDKLTTEDISKLPLEELMKRLEEAKRNRGLNVMMPNASTANKKKEVKKPREIF